MEKLNPIIIGVLAFVLLHNVMTDHEEDSNYFKQLRNGIYSISTCQKAEGITFRSCQSQCQGVLGLLDQTTKCLLVIQVYLMI